MEIFVNIKNSRSKNINRDSYLKYLEIMKPLLNTTTNYLDWFLLVISPELSTNKKMNESKICQVDKSNFM